MTIRLSRFAAVEFWAITTYFIFVLIFFVSPAFDGVPEVIDAPNKWLFERAGVPFNYYQHYLIPMLIRYCALFAAFAFLNFRLVPRILQKEHTRTNVLWILLTVVGVFIVNLLTNFYLKQYLFFTSANKGAAYNSLWQMTFVYTFRLVLIVAAYTLIKYAGLNLFERISQSGWKSKYVNRELLIVLALWVIVAIFFATMQVPELFTLWLVAVPCAILLYVFAHHFWLPHAIQRRRPFRYFIVRALLYSFLAFVASAMLLLVITEKKDMAFGVAMVNGFIQFLVVAPACWMAFKRRMQGKEELFALKKELGHSAANLDFLRSQINPHFLFNALNTIYGTAIQEGAERTSEGIEKLGDMMRFMLLENVQEKIALTREIDYLNNYISLQKLRSDTSPDINIQVDIQQEISPVVQIAPMLLIPFIENAFKHGISLREASHIRISLELKGSVLYFDVYNSKHQRLQNDPEKENNGIGLANVKQRLQLLYPGKHELVIRETAKDFFVHLTLNLGK